MPDSLFFSTGADVGIRTPDLVITNQMLDLIISITFTPVEDFLELACHAHNVIRLFNRMSF